MLASYLILAYRNFVKERFFSLLNVLGLAVGLSVVFLIWLYSVYELGFDRFHPQAGQTYRVVSYLEMGPNQGDYNATFSQMGAAMLADLSETEVAVRVLSQDGVIFRAGKVVFPEDKLVYADPDFFKLFNFRILSGDTSQILTKPYEVLLTPFLVGKYFGGITPEAVIGQAIEINRELYTVRGVIETSPANSHLRYGAIASFGSLPQSREKEWLGMNVILYVHLRAGTDPAAVDAKFDGILERHMKDYRALAKRGIIIRPYLQALTSIHLHSRMQGELETNGAMTTLYIFATVGFVVLLLACVNFVNLTTARSANRAKEVGVRKVVGAAAVQLMRQFVLESVLMVLVAAVAAVLVVAVVQYPFNAMTGKTLSVATLFEPLHLAVLVGFVVALGIVAGSYPSFFLSSFNPTQVLRGAVRLGFGSRRLRSTLVVIQFAISIVLITATLVVDGQLTYMRSQKLGFDQENVIVVENGDKIPGATDFIQAVRGVKAVRDVGTGAFKPIGSYDGMPLVAEHSENVLLVNFSNVDDTYLRTLQYEFVAGRNFLPDEASDSAALIVNESAAMSLLGDSAIGRKLVYLGERYTVIGIVKDFNFQSLRNAVSPVVFFRMPAQRYICIRLRAGDPNEGVAAIAALWKKRYPDLPFVYTYLDETYANLYDDEVRLGLTFGIFTVLALLIACLGLVGLAVYMSQQRSKEISVRKVFGASIAQIALLLSRDFIRLILLACVIAVPTAYYLMDLWLHDFAYRIPISAWLLAEGCLVVLVAGIGAVSIQSIRASVLNPGQSLKEE